MTHPTSKKHPRMTLENRAAQFSPFAALTGYEAAVEETARLTDQRIELDENEKSELNQSLAVLEKKLADSPSAVITYFVPDSRKSGGAYVTVSGIVKKIKDYEQMLVLEDGTRIAFEDIVVLQVN